MKGKRYGRRMKDGREGNQMVFPNTFEDGEDSMMPYVPMD